ncbi:MAG: retroviral-like aspartic protease family protein [Syntrophobacteraceae bacterium]|jgi:clan AA aspartic protease (TIGR02281 family)
MTRFKLVLVVALLIGFVPLAHAGFDEGKAAYDRGDYAKAYKEFKPLADQGNASAQCSLARMYYFGQGVPHDLAEAAKWYRKAAEQGSADAQIKLGRMYEMDYGVPKDNSEAVRWYRKAAEQGNADAENWLGLAYANGWWGVPKDNSEAVRWYRKAAEQGLAGAQHILGFAYANGYGVPQDYAEAVKWYRKAAEQGDTKAQSALDAISRGGVGAQKVEIPLERGGPGVYELPVRINGVLTLKFILDTGASEVNIPADVASTLLRTGTITQSDFLPGKSYTLADGSIVRSSRFTIRELEIGGIKISQVSASVGPANGSLLLGQSFLERLKSWSLDNERHVLIIGGGTIHPR